MRWACGIEYDGSQFHGWQRQSNDLNALHDTVQETLEKAISAIAETPITITCSGRTDAGVHAVQQVIHFDTEVERPIAAWIKGVNTILKRSITVHWAQPMPQDFHARYSATNRAYRYIIYNNRVRPALFRDYMTWEYRDLDVGLMEEGAKVLIGEHDFTSFRSSICQARHPIRTITKLSLHRNDNLIIMDIEANAFLHHMVRNIAGVLLCVGSKRHPTDWVKEVLEARNRSEAANTASANGLYLLMPYYPEVYKIPNPTVSIPLVKPCQFPSTQVQ